MQPIRSFVATSRSPLSRSPCTPALIVLCCLLATSGLAGSAAAQSSQQLLFTLRGDAIGDDFGYAVTTVGDLDKDGTTEIAVGADQANNQTGYVRVFRGKTGAALTTLTGAAAGDMFGFSIRDAGDVDKDGFRDLIVGAPGNGTTPGYAVVVSGLWLLSGGGTKHLYTFQGATAGDEYGISVAGGGDIDKDGYPDLLIGARQKGTGTGYGESRSGRTGAVMFTYTAVAGDKMYARSVANAGDVNLDGYTDAVLGGSYLWRVVSGKDGTILNTARNSGGKAVAGLGDINKDGHADIAVFDGASGLPRQVYVYSGKDWSRLYSLSAGKDAVESTFVSAAGDVDNDGYPDMIVHNGGSPSYPVRIYSGKDGTSMMQFTGTASAFGYSVSDGGDVNGDGVIDVLVGAPGDATNYGTAFVYSTQTLALAADVHEISRTTGGTQSFSLQAGAAHSGRPYWIFGSITGTTPGIDLLGVHIPLNPDPYTDLAIANVTVNPPFNAFRGALDAAGAATSSLIVPPLPPGTFTLFHAYLVYDAKGKFHMASNAVPMTVK